MGMNALVLAAMLATQAPADAAPAPDAAAEAAGKAYWTSLGTQMRRSDSARERALSARWDIEDPIAGGKLLREAAKAAPTDPLVQMMWSTFGSTWSGCDAASPCPEQVMAWARLEPDNGMAWLPVFEANVSADDKSIDAAISRIAAASRYDDNLVETWKAYRLMMAAHPMPSLVVASSLQGEGGAGKDPGKAREAAEGIAAMAYAAALPMPMQSLLRACKRALHEQLSPARFEDCARIGRGIVHSDSSVMSKNLGSALVRVSGLESDADRAARRSLDWRQESATEVLVAQQPGDIGAYFADLAATGSETRAQELLMARHGISLEPPSDWHATSR